MLVHSSYLITIIQVLQIPRTSIDLAIDMNLNHSSKDEACVCRETAENAADQK